MYRQIIFLIAIFIAVPVAYADDPIVVSAPPFCYQEEDGTPNGCYKRVKFANGTLTDNGDGTFSHSQAGAGGGDITDVGPLCSSGACFTDGTNDTLVFEGTTADTVETTFGATDPTSGDQTYNLPDAAATGTYELTANTVTQTLTNKTMDSDNNTFSNIAMSETKLTAGAGLSLSTDTLATDSSEADFIASGALTCGASTQGKAQVHTTPLQYCDNAATPALQYAAYGDSSGNAAGVQANSVALTTDTTGNYVASVTNGTNVSGGDGGSEGAALTLAVSGDLTAIDSIDATGAVDLDIGSADVTDVTVVTDGGTIVLDGSITQDAGTTLFMGGLLDATGAVDMDYGSADITDHTFTTDGTGDAEIVLPTGSISTGEILNDTITASDVDETGQFDFAILAGKQDRAGTAVDDDDCTGEQSSWWWDSTDNAFEFCNANSGAPATLGGGSGAFSDASDPVVLNTTTKDVSIGASHINTSKLSVDGDADTPQFTVQQHSTQTDDAIILENSAGTELFSVSPSPSIKLLEVADAPADTAGYGQIWVNTATPNELYFTDDAGTDHQLGTAGGSGATNYTLPIYSAKITGAFVTMTPAGCSTTASTQGAGIDAGQGNWRLLFDASTDEAAVWQFVIPDNYSSTPVLDVHFSMASAESLEVEYEAAIMCYTPTTDTADIGTASFANCAVGTATTVSATAGEAYSQSITLTDDSCAAGDTAFIWLSTDADDATNDDATGDREVVNVEFSYS